MSHIFSSLFIWLRKICLFYFYFLIYGMMQPKIWRKPFCDDLTQKNDFQKQLTTFESFFINSFFFLCIVTVRLKSYYLFDWKSTNLCYLFSFNNSIHLKTKFSWTEWTKWEILRNYLKCHLHFSRSVLYVYTAHTSGYVTVLVI